MKTLYSSTFLTAILAFLLLLNQTGQAVTVVQGEPKAIFQTIIEPIGPALASPDGKVSLEVFNTFGCQECDNFGLGTLPALWQKYADHALVDLRLFLVPNVEDEGEFYATRGSHCAAQYGRFWEMVVELHNTDVLSNREVDLSAQGLGFPVVEFRSCLRGEIFDEQITKDNEYARQKGITKKPTIYVNGTMMIGAQPLENIDREVNKYLNN